jgi:hypothetical protein
LRLHHVGLIALFVALGGTSYAAIRLPAHSVGTRQLTTGAVTSAKIKNRSIKEQDLTPGVASTLRGPVGPPGAPGPDGPRGQTGERGPRGPSDAYAAFFGKQDVPPSAVPLFTLAEMDLPAGDYALFANAIAAYKSAPSHTGRLDCGLGDDLSGSSDPFDNAADSGIWTFPTAGYQTIDLTGVVSLGTPSTVYFGCYQSPGGGDGWTFSDIDIGATQVGSVH